MNYYRYTQYYFLRMRDVQDYDVVDFFLNEILFLKIVLKD